MTALDLSAAMDDLSALQHRARILLLVGNGIIAEGRSEFGNAIAQIAEDMRRNLEVLFERLDSLEAGQ
ncbi:hypothetical protein [Antarcticirhabdus aurantiaca]|uniref:Uncharacterized protein n=1 Tax=Antarcticirhabdus aurantiaca TaxID=2606717 RepID=A0ACD4NWT2_9HYPH|nr:hypothetical protein [Antarcticirhabdus aurantiaca]WAJ31173.1 hypothetical protein OXU80_13620 [Jeongeuplla avenae]